MILIYITTVSIIEVGIAAARKMGCLGEGYKNIIIL